MTDRLVGELLARLTAVETEVTKLRDWKHKMANETFVPLQLQMVEIKTLLLEMKDREKASTTGENRTLRARDFYIAAACLGAGWIGHLWIASH